MRRRPYGGSNRYQLVVAFAPMREMHKHKALAQMGLRDLQKWTRVYQQRDQVVYQAYVSGVGVNEIARVTGLAKTTVIRILREVQGQ